DAIIKPCLYKNMLRLLNSSFCRMKGNCCARQLQSMAAVVCRNYFIFSIHLLCFNYLNILRFFLSEPAAKRNHLDCLQDDNIFINTIKKHINLYIARIEQGRMPCLARPVKTKNLFMKKYFFLCAATASLAGFACNS